jgi:uncharacterized membrane protein YhiD involved in acid resistance
MLSLRRLLLAALAVGMVAGMFTIPSALLSSSIILIVLIVSFRFVSVLPILFTSIVSLRIRPSHR